MSRSCRRRHLGLGRMLRAPTSLCDTQTGTSMRSGYLQAVSMSCNLEPTSNACPPHVHLSASPCACWYASHWRSARWHWTSPDHPPCLMLLLAPAGEALVLQVSQSAYAAAGAPGWPGDMSRGQGRCVEPVSVRNVHNVSDFDRFITGAPLISTG